MFSGRNESGTKPFCISLTNWTTASFIRALRGSSLSFFLYSVAIIPAEKPSGKARALWLSLKTWAIIGDTFVTCGCRLFFCYLRPAFLRRGWEHSVACPEGSEALLVCVGVRAFGGE
eukprot:560237-Rhodomonas_salina.1